MEKINKNRIGGHPLDEFYSKIYKKYDRINRLFTLGQDVRWRRITARKCLSHAPASVIDLCCGTGDLALEIHRLSTPEDVKITGFDFNGNMLLIAREKAQKKAFDTIQFTEGDAAKMPFSDNSFDAMTIGFGFRNLTFENPNASLHLAEINRILKPGGRLYILESGVPSNRYIRFGYNLYLRYVLIPLGGIISGDWNAYSYLARSSANFFPVKEVERMLSDYGFGSFELESFMYGATNLVTVKKLKQLSLK
jgi:demethylmenaquinone methyltransferase/2-methoxy-6-polyprenyl-1,4-benzoquinol methylase